MISLAKQNLIVSSILFVFINFSTKLAESQELKRYTCEVGRIDFHTYESSRTFDKDGIIMYQNKYHPLNIAKYGLKAYYEFLDTGDSIYYQKCINQIKYFNDSSKVNTLYNGKGIGLPYNFKFKDLKAPWYSGMTQGYALSYLLRYYRLTKDETIIPIIKKVAFVLISRQETGGTISTPKKGHTWIEEYPNSKRSKQVLNGFINGLIGLYEYCNFFPDDLNAKQIFSETYECLKTNLEYYDTPNWTYYNRNKTPITYGYLIYQIYEMKHLYELFRDPIFDAQMRIWSVMLTNKLNGGAKPKKKLLNPYNSEVVIKMNNSLYHIPLSVKQLLATDSLQTSIFRSVKEYKRYSKGKRQKKAKRHSKVSFINFTPSTAITDYLEITFSDSTLSQYKITACKKSKTHVDKLVTIDSKKILYKNRLFMSIPESDISNIIIKLENKNKFNLTTNEVRLFNTSLDKNPFFAHHVSKPFELKTGNSYKINLSMANTEKAVLFYKFAPSGKSLNNSKWKAINTIQLSNNFTPAIDGTYLFMIVFNWNSPLSSIGSFTLTPVEKLHETSANLDKNNAL